MISIGLIGSMLGALSAGGGGTLLSPVKPLGVGQRKRERGKERKAGQQKGLSEFCGSVDNFSNSELLPSSSKRWNKPKIDFYPKPVLKKRNAAPLLIFS